MTQSMARPMGEPRLSPIRTRWSVPWTPDEMGPCVREWVHVRQWVRMKMLFED